MIGIVGGGDIDRLNSPKPAATRRCGDTPLPTRYCTTAMARDADRFQFDLERPPVTGRTSVWPSTRTTQANVGGDFLLRVPTSAVATLSMFGGRLRLQFGLAGIEEQLGLQHEAVAGRCGRPMELPRISRNAEEVGRTSRSVASTFAPKRC